MKYKKTPQENLPDGTIIGKPGKVKRASSKHSSRPNLRRFKLILPLSILLLGILLGWLYISNRQAEQISTQCRPDSEDSITKEAVNFLDPTKTLELEQEVSKIKETPGYDSDANCVYVVLRYYINVGDVDNAKQYLDKLLAVYDPEIGIQVYGVNISNDPDALKEEVSFLETQQAESENNRMFFN